MGQKKIKVITIEVSNDAGLKAIKALEEKKQIRIVKEFNFNSPVLPGSSMNIKAFKDLIAESEGSPKISLKEVKKQWAEKRKQLLKRIK